MTEAPLVIDSIAAGGDGVGRIDSLVVFVPRAAPGDSGVVSYEVHGRLARGRWRTLEIPSESRVTAPCAHYISDSCGGCQLQHISYDAQLVAKERIVRDALQRIGSSALEHVHIHMHAAPSPYRYRRKLTLSIRRSASGIIAGLHRYDRPSEVFSLSDCLITERGVVDAWQNILRHHHFLPAAAELRGSVSILDDQTYLTVEGGNKWRSVTSLIEACPFLSAVWWVNQTGVMKQVWGAVEEHSVGASFAQVNTAVAELLRAHVKGLVRSGRPQHVVDAYAGTGELASELALLGTSVTAIEQNRFALDGINPQDGVEVLTVVGRVEDNLSAFEGSDVAVLNPPRAGIHERVAAHLETSSAPPATVIYVSCNPATLARDIRRMPSYSIGSVHCFDMFPQTAHVETVVALVRMERA